jgi:hypothetical protein
MFTLAAEQEHPGHLAPVPARRYSTLSASRPGPRAPVSSPAHSLTAVRCTCQANQRPPHQQPASVRGSCSHDADDAAARTASYGLPPILIGMRPASRINQPGQ